MQNAVILKAIIFMRAITKVKNEAKDALRNGDIDKYISLKKDLERISKEELGFDEIEMYLREVLCERSF